MRGFSDGPGPDGCAAVDGDFVSEGWKGRAVRCERVGIGGKGEPVWSKSVGPIVAGRGSLFRPYSGALR